MDNIRPSYEATLIICSQSELFSVAIPVRGIHSVVCIYYRKASSKNVRKNWSYVLSLLLLSVIPGSLQHVTSQPTNIEKQLLPGYVIKELVLEVFWRSLSFYANLLYYPFFVMVDINNNWFYVFLRGLFGHVADWYNNISFCFSYWMVILLCFKIGARGCIFRNACKKYFENCRFIAQLIDLELYLLWEDYWLQFWLLFILLWLLVKSWIAYPIVPFWYQAH